MTSNSTIIEPKNLREALQIIYLDLLERGLTELPDNLVKNLWDEYEIDTSRIFVLNPTSEELHTLFKYGCYTFEDSSLLTANFKFPTEIKIVEESDDGHGRECRVVFQYTTLNNQNIYIKYTGTYDSWSSSDWEYISLAKEPKQVITYYYPEVDSLYL